MLRSIKQLYGDKLGASDGEIGHVKDFYFDDQNWAVRYVVADTGSWLPGRQVLLSPHAFGRLRQAEKVLRVNLTRKQIEDSPSIESHKTGVAAIRRGVSPLLRLALLLAGGRVVGHERRSNVGTAVKDTAG